MVSCQLQPLGKTIFSKLFKKKIFYYSYGDLSPVTPLGRALASLCAIFGISVVSILVSVLAERYQRVYTRKLFLNEQYSDDIVLKMMKRLILH